MSHFIAIGNLRRANSERKAEKNQHPHGKSPNKKRRDWIVIIFIKFKTKKEEKLILNLLFI